MQNITPSDWLKIAENDNFDFVTKLLNALTYPPSTMLNVLYEHLDDFNFTEERANIIKAFYPINCDTIIAKWRSECCCRCGACPEEVTCSRNFCYECYETDGNFDGERSYDINGYLCYWDAEECDWIANEKHATQRFMNVLKGMKTFEGFHYVDSDGETTHEDFDDVICKSCNLPFYDILEDAPFCNCQSPPEPDYPPSDYCQNI